MGQFISPADLAPFATIDDAKASAMVEDAEAMATLTAPCLAELPDDDPRRKSVKAILRGAILRWNDAGTGAVQQIGAGPFQQTIQPTARRAMFWPSEIEQLQGLCATKSGKAYTIDTAPGGTAHAPWCDAMFAPARGCSCGADLAGVPIYENVP